MPVQKSLETYWRHHVFYYLVLLNQFWLKRHWSLWWCLVVVFERNHFFSQVFHSYHILVFSSENLSFDISIVLFFLLFLFPSFCCAGCLYFVCAVTCRCKSWYFGGGVALVSPYWCFYTNINNHKTPFFFSLHILSVFSRIKCPVHRHQFSCPLIHLSEFLPCLFQQLSWVTYQRELLWCLYIC